MKRNFYQFFELICFPFDCIISDLNLRIKFTICINYIIRVNIKMIQSKKKMISLIQFFLLLILIYIFGWFFRSFYFHFKLILDSFYDIILFQLLNFRFASAYLHAIAKYFLIDEIFLREKIYILAKTAPTFEHSILIWK